MNDPQTGKRATVPTPIAKAKARRARTPNFAYGIRVGPKQPGRTLYVIGFSYPPVTRLRKEPIGSHIDYRPFDKPADAPAVKAIVIASGCVAILGRGPAVFGWTDTPSGKDAAQETARRIVGAVVIRVRNHRGPM
jgi:hypothetical protein